MSSTLEIVDKENPNIKVGVYPWIDESGHPRLDIVIIKPTTDIRKLSVEDVVKHLKLCEEVAEIMREKGFKVKL